MLKKFAFTYMHAHIFYFYFYFYFLCTYMSYAVVLCLGIFTKLESYISDVSRSFPKWHKATRHHKTHGVHQCQGGKNTSATMEFLVATETQSKECHLWCKLSCASVSDGALLPVLWRRSMLFMEGSHYTTWHTFNMDYFTQFYQLDTVQDVISIYGSYFIHFLHPLPIHTL